MHFRSYFTSLILALSALPAPAGGALAAEFSSLAAPPVFTWTGAYSGQTGGYTFGGKDTAPPDNFWSKAFDAAGSAFNATGASGQDHSLLGGGEFGVNYQLQSVVLGLESDLTYTNLATAAAPSALSTGTESVAYTSGMSGHWLSTFRGRFGTALDDRLLVYTTAGLAVAGRNYDNGYEVLSPSGQDYSLGTGTKAAGGIAIGGGLEYALTKNWTLKGEYLYTDVGAAHTFGSAPIGGGAANHASDLDEKVLRAAINYKFDLLSK